RPRSYGEISVLRGIPLPFPYLFRPIPVRRAESPFRRPQIVWPPQVDVESLFARFRELLIVHVERQGDPASQSVAHHPMVSTDEEGVETACRYDQFQGLGDRRLDLINLNLDSGSTRYRFTLDLPRLNRLNLFCVSAIVLLRGTQFLEDSLPPFVAGFGKVAFDCLHRGSAHRVDGLGLQAEKGLDLVRQRVDVTPWRDETVHSLLDQIPGAIGDVVHDGDATSSHGLHQRQRKALARARQHAE